jgi:MFS family permease
VLFAPWVGKLGDKVGRRRIVLLGYALYAGINLCLMVASTQASVWLVVVVYGLFYAIDESQSKAYIADLEPHRRGSALGVYGFVTGILYLLASLIAGALWRFAPEWAFASSASLSLLAMWVFIRLNPASGLQSE